MKVLYITGYKPFELGIFNNKHEAIPYIKKSIKNTLMTMAEDGLEWVIITGQPGVELWAAESLFEIEKECELKLAVLTPYLNQEESWNDQKKEQYRQVLAKADFVDSISRKPYEGPAQLRAKNLFMVHKSDGMLIFFDEEKDGSPKFAFRQAKQYQENHEYPISQITFDDLQNIIEEENWNRS